MTGYFSDVVIKFVYKLAIFDHAHIPTVTAHIPTRKSNQNPNNNRVIKEYI
jgi:hypothetical protein